MLKTLLRHMLFFGAALIMVSGRLCLSATELASSVRDNGVSFQPFPVAHKVFAVVADDVDRDGRLDLLVTYRGEETAQVFYQKMPRQFEAGPATKVLGFHPNGLTRFPSVEHRYVLSAEGDATLKVLGLDQSGEIKEIARRPQEGAFATTTFFWPGWGTSLAVAPYQGSGLYLLRNFQSETAGVDKEYVLGKPGHTVPGEVTVADLNGDSIPELFYTTRRSRTLWRISYPKDGQDPESVAVWKAPIGAPRHLVMADMNGDGALDVLLPLESERRIAVLLNDGKGDFVPGPELPVASPIWGPQRLAIAEDRDGFLLLVASTDRSLMFYRIQKGIPYRYETTELPLKDARVNQVLSLQDVDRDGDLDLLVSLSKIEDSLQILYGPIWKALTKQRDLVWSDQQSQLPAGLEPDLTGDRAVALVDDPARILAQVDDHKITLAEFRQFVLRSGLGDELRTKKGRIKVLRQMIEQALFDKAIKQGRSASESFSPEGYAAALRALENTYFPAPPRPEDAVSKTYYDANKEKFGIPEMVRVVQIQFRHDRDVPGNSTAKQRAERALQRLEAGEDFVKVASESTENPRARETGPDRGFVPRNAESWLQDALSGLQLGQRTGIVSSPAGYEILMMTDLRPALISDYEAVRDKVAKQWQAEQQQKVRESYLKALAKQFGVTVIEKGLENANPANW